MRRSWSTPFLGRLVFSFWTSDARRKYSQFKDQLYDHAQIIEIGSGPGSLLNLLRQEGFSVDALDITDTAYSEDLVPQLYNGNQMPFEESAYDVAILATMLHHTPDPDAILEEAVRVAKRLIIIEDIYDGPIMEWLTKRADSIMNLEFFGHPHSNRSHEAWLETFKARNLKMVHQKAFRVGGIFKQIVYV